jgi:hypothetical protein
MSQNQFSAQDTTSQHVQPDGLPDEQIEHPGLESDMALEPDYGESTYRGSGRQEARELSSPVVIPGFGRAGRWRTPGGADVLISNLSAIWTPLTPATMPAELARVHVSPAYQESS